MAKGFNLTAELNLRGPSNVRQVVSNINKQLKGVKASVNLTIDPNSAKNIASINRNLIGLNKTLKSVQATSKSVSANISGIAAQFNTMSTAATKAASSTANVSQNISNTGKQAQAAGAQVAKATTLMEDFGKQSALAVKRFAAFSLVTSAVFSLTNAINQAFKQFIEFDRQLVRLQQVTGKTADGLKAISSEITNLSTSLGVASSDLISVSTTLAQAGLSARETEKALKALALSALAPSFDDLNRTVEGSIALMRQFGISAGDLEKALGSVNAVAASFAVEAGDIIAAIQRTGGVFAAASRGVSEGTDALNEFVAVFTSVRATTRESAETIATGLRTIFTRIQRGSTIEALKEFGITLTDVDGKFVGAYKAIQLLSQGLNQLDPRDVKFSTLVEELGGFRQIGKVIPLIQQFATAQKALAVAQAGQGSLAEDAATAQLSLSNQIAKVREEFLGLIREIGGTDSFKAITKSALDLASALIQIADSVKGVLPVLGVVLAGKGLRAGFGFAKGFGKELKGKASGGLVTKYAAGGLVDVALMPGETVVSPEVVKKIGVGTLNRMNKADKMAKGGLAKVPGTGRADSFYTQIPEKSYVIRTDATNALGDKTISDIASGRQKFADGGQTKKTQQGQQVGGVGVFDSDMIGAGSKQILNAIRSSGKPYSVISGPAGSGKTTFATRKFGKNFIRSAADIEKYARFAVLSGAGATKTGDFSTEAQSLMSGAAQVIALQPSSEQVMSQRQQRIADAESSGLPDTRSIGQLKGTMKAPTQIDSNLYKKFGNVQFVQKFASGGILRDIETDSNLQVGAAVLESVNANSSPLAISSKDITAVAQRKAGLDPKTEQINQANFNTKNVRGITGVKQGLSKQTETSFRAAIDQGLVEAVNYAGGTLSKDLGLPFTSVDQGSKSSFLSGVNSASVGNLFEDVLTGMSAGYASRTAGQNFDFPGGLGGSLKDNYLGLPEKWVDAKASSKEAKFTGSGSLQAKTLNQIGSEIAANRQLYIKSRDQGTSEDLSKKTDLDPSRTYTLAELKQFGINSTDDAKKRGLTSPFRGKWQMRAMASGGEVPILAQEGEYVINRNSARSIGYGNLEKLNKYHSGGRVQKMAGGGKPNKSAQIGSLGLPSGLAGKLTQVTEALMTEMTLYGIGLKSHKAAYDKGLIGINQIADASPELAQALNDNHKVNRRGYRAQARINTEIATLIEDMKKSGKTHKQQQKELLKATKNLQRENAAASKRFSILKTVEQQWSRLTKAIKTTTGKMLGMKIGGGMPSDASWRRGFRTDGQPGRQSRAGGMNSTTGLAIALPLITDAFTNSAEATTAATAATNAFAQSLTTNLGVGLILSDTLGDLASSLPGKVGAIAGPIVQGVSLVATAAFALAKAYADSQEAARKFDIDEGKRKIEEETENIAKILENIDKTGKALPATLARLDDALKTSTDAALSAADAMNNQYRGSVVQNAVEFFRNPTPQGQVEGQGDRSQINRSIILQERGVMAYLSALNSTTTELSLMRSILPKISKESAALFASQAKNVEDVLVAKLQQGVSIGDIMNGPEWSKQAEVLARANAAIEKQILLIDTNTTLTEEEKAARKQNIISLEANRIAAEKVKQVALEKNLASLANATNKLSYSFNRILSNMQNAVAGASSELAQLEANASDLTSSLSGQAVSSGTSEIDKLISVIESPRGFSAAERGTAFNTATRGFGASADNVSKVLEIGTSIEDTILKTINNITANAAPGTTNEAIGAQVGAAIDRNLSNIGLPPELSNKLSREIGNQVSKLRQSGDDNIDFAEIVEQVPGLGSALETFKTASSAVTANLKFLQESFQKLSSTTNQLIDSQLDSNNRFLRSQQIAIDGYNNLAQALGKNISLSQQRFSIEANIRGRTGGTTDPGQIRKNITNLSDRKSNLEDKKAAAQAAQDPGLVQEFERQIKQTSVSLNENVAALKDMAESSDLASAALNKIQQAQEKQRAGIGIIEKLVTSTPKQLNELNNSAYRLSRNMAGMGNFGTTGEQRQQDLELFNMIAPLLGDQAEPLKANVLQSMLQQSGVGVTPMFQQILDTMRNPQADPVQAEAIKTYQEAISKQSDANTELAKINNNLADSIANRTAKAIADAISKVQLKFDTSQLDDIVTNTNRPDLDQPKPAKGVASGGLIYKADGGNVNKTIFQPKGTDTVPAMLTPGEFVVNRKATSKNLPLLKSINNGKMSSGTRYYAAGGLVNNNNFLKDKLEPDQSADIKVSNDPLKIINDSFFSNNNSNNSSILGARLPLYPKYSNNQKSFVEPIRTELGKSMINNAADWIEELGLLGNFFPALFIYSRIIGGIARAVRIAALQKPISNNPIDINKNLTGWGVGRPSTIVEQGGGVLKSFRTLAQGDGDKFWEEVLSNVTSVAVLGGTIADKLGGGLLPEYTLAPNNFNPKVDKLGTLPFQVGDITSGAFPSLFSGPVKLNQEKPLTDLASYNSNDGSTSDSKSIQTQKKLAEQLKKRIQTINANITAEQFVDPVNISKSDAGFKEVAANSVPLSQLLFPLDPVAELKNPDQYTSMQVSDAAVDFATNINEASNTLGVTGKDFGIGNNSVAQGQQQGIDPKTVIGFLSQKDAKIQEIDQYLSTLKNYDKPENFQSLSTEKIDFNKIEKLMSEIESDQLPKLYANIPNKYLNDKWKTEVGGDDLSVWKSTLTDKWKSGYLDVQGENPDLLQGVYLGTNPVTVNGKKRAWSASSRSEDIATYFQAQLDQAQKEAKEKSEFKVGELQQSSLYNIGTANELLEGLGQKDINVAFGYRKIDMPKYTKKTGYTESEGRLEGIIPVLGNTIDPFTIDPFIKEVSKGSPENLYDNPEIFANELREYYRSILENSWNAKTGEITGGSAFKFGGKVLNKIQSETLANIDPNRDAREIVRGSTTADWYTLLPALKEKILSQVGSEIQQAGSDKADDFNAIDLETLQKTARGVISPISGILARGRVLIPNLTGLEGLSPFGDYLNRASDYVGSFVRSPNSPLVNVFGQLKALGEIFSLFGANKVDSAFSALGVGREAFSKKDGDNSSSAINDADSLAKAIQTYGILKSKQGLLSLGGDTSVLSQTIDKNGKLGNTGQTIAEVFKSGKIELADVDTEFGGFTSTTASEAQAPKDLKEVGKIVLNPYNVMPSNVRTALTVGLVKSLQQARLGYAAQAVKAVGTYLAQQDDFLLADGNNPAEEATYKNANQALLLLTDGALGLLPNTEKLQQMKAARAQQQKQQQAQTKARGGLIYASNGTLVNFQPQGTDTVPAMLTPGEFVINRQSTQKHLPLLKAINNAGSSGLSSSQAIQRFATGGIVQPKYYQDAGMVSGGNAVMKPVPLKIEQKSINDAKTAISSAITEGAKTLSGVLSGVNILENSESFVNAISSFTRSVNNIVSNLASINLPEQIQFTGNVQVNLTGANNLTEAAESIVNNAIRKAFGDLGVANEGSIVIPQQFK